MKLSGSYTFSAPRDDVWQLLNDPQTLQRIIPGCERLEEVGQDTYAADIKLGLAGVRGDYSWTMLDWTHVLQTCGFVGRFRCSSLRTSCLGGGFRACDNLGTPYCYPRGGARTPPS